MRFLLPLLLSLALPVMAAPKYKIQAKNQFLIFSDLKFKFPVSVCCSVILLFENYGLADSRVNHHQTFESMNQSVPLYPY